MGVGYFTGGEMVGELEGVERRGREGEDQLDGRGWEELEEFGVDVEAEGDWEAEGDVLVFVELDVFERW